MPIIADVWASDGPTLDQLVTEVQSAVQGFSIAPEKVSVLDGDITATDTSFTVAGSTTLSPGVLEIDNELIYVISVDPNSSTCAVHPNGRGWQGTVAATHSAGAAVFENPAIPRVRAAWAINDVVSSLFPTLFAVGTVDATIGSTRVVELPEEAEFVLDVRWLDNAGEWQRVRTWETEMSNAASVTGRSVLIPRQDQGDSVRVVYGYRPQRFVTDTSYWSETGLPIAVKDAVVLGALSKVARVFDLGRLSDRFTRPQGDNEKPPLGIGFQMARDLDAKFREAVASEANALRRLYPVRQHFTR